MFWSSIKRKQGNNHEYKYNTIKKSNDREKWFKLSYERKFSVCIIDSLEKSKWTIELN